MMAQRGVTAALSTRWALLQPLCLHGVVVDGYCCTAGIEEPGVLGLQEGCRTVPAAAEATAAAQRQWQ